MSRNSDVTIALKPMFNYNRYGSVKFDDQNNIYSFEEKAQKDFGYINCGYIFLKKEVFAKYLINRPFSFEEEFIKTHLSKLRICAFVDDSYFIDIGIPEDYLKTRTDYTMLM
jgi:D-glycero-alpha-D-manno-heptose 1-phosphate guanylyltransferase